MTNIVEVCKACGIVPVVVLEDADRAIPLARAMLKGGVNTMEITFRTSSAVESIRLVANEVPEMLVGAGTVRNLDECKNAMEAGAKFIVSPALDVETVQYCIRNDITVFPGTVTPTDVNTARNLGLRMVKFFPAGVYGGLEAIKALHGPFPDMVFLPTGGVNMNNLADYLKAPYIAAVGGSWIVPEDIVNSGDYDTITKLCAQAREAIDAARKGGM